MQGQVVQYMHLPVDGDSSLIQSSLSLIPHFLKKSLELLLNRF